MLFAHNPCSFHSVFKGVNGWDKEKIIKNIYERTGSGSGGLFKKIRPLVIHNDKYNHINTFHPKTSTSFFSGVSILSMPPDSIGERLGVRGKGRGI